MQSTAPGCDASGTLDPLLATLRTGGNQIETLGPVEAWYWRDGDTLVPALRQRVREHKAGNAKASQVQLFARCDGEQELGRRGSGQLPTLCMSPTLAICRFRPGCFDPDPAPAAGRQPGLARHAGAGRGRLSGSGVPLPVSLQAGQYRLSGPMPGGGCHGPESAPYSSSDAGFSP